VESIHNTSGDAVPKRQIIEQTVKVAQDFDAFYSLESEPEITTVGMPLEAGTLCAASFQKIYTQAICTWRPFDAHEGSRSR